MLTIINFARDLVRKRNKDIDFVKVKRVKIDYGIALTMVLSESSR